MYLRGLDISHWQGVFFPTIFLNKGLNFLISKGSDFFNNLEVGFYDSRVRYNAEAAFSYSIPFGIYMWFKPQYNPIKQADFYLDLYWELVPQLKAIVDFEELPKNLSGSEILYKLEVLLNYFEQKVGYRPILYSRDTIISSLPENKRGFLKRYPYWKAWYPYRPPFFTKQQYEFFPENDLKLSSLVYPFEEENLVLWQFSEKGRGNFYGVSSGYVDLDYCIKDLPIVNPPSTITEEIITVRIVATLGLRVREQPDLTSKILKVLKYNTTVRVNLKESTYDFYKLADEDGYIFKNWTRKVE